MEQILIEEITPFVQAGAVGISVALIVLLAFVIKCVFAIITKGTEIQQELIAIVKQDAEKTEENTAVLRELKEQLAICNAIKK